MNKPRSIDKPKKTFMKPVKSEDTDQYLSLDQLLPLDNPESDVKGSFEDLRSLDWSRQFNACNTLRRASVNHPEILISKTPGQIHGMALDMVKIAESLRSSLVKNCLLTLNGN